MEYNLYCDESGHLEHDHLRVMVIGAIQCPLKQRKKIVREIRSLKEKHRMNQFCEVKWTKVSPNHLAFYEELISYFFHQKDLSFRAVLLEKEKIDHKMFNQTHEVFYYKVYYQLLIPLLIKKNTYRVYLDQKDTKSFKKIEKLKQCLAYGNDDFDQNCLKNIQIVNSKESELIQLCDILIGAIGYLNRGEGNMENASNAKQKLIRKIQSLSGYTLRTSTVLTEDKCNLFKLELQ